MSHASEARHPSFRRPRAPKRREVLLTATHQGAAVEAAVSLDGEHVGLTPLLVEREPGRYQVLLRLTGLPPVRVEVTVSDERGAELEVPLGFTGSRGGPLVGFAAR